MRKKRNEKERERKAGKSKRWRRNKVISIMRPHIPKEINDVVLCGVAMGERQHNTKTQETALKM